MDFLIKKYPYLKNEPLIEEVKKALEKMEEASLKINDILIKVKETSSQKIGPDNEID